MVLQKRALGSAAWRRHEPGKEKARAELPRSRVRKRGWKLSLQYLYCYLPHPPIPLPSCPSHSHPHPHYIVPGVLIQVPWGAGNCVSSTAPWYSHMAFPASTSPLICTLFSDTLAVWPASSTNPTAGHRLLFHAVLLWWSLLCPLPMF